MKEEKEFISFVAIYECVGVFACMINFHPSRSPAFLLLPDLGFRQGQL
jgi:hypothetical protein